MIPHSPDHDPTIEHIRCEVCNAALRAAFIQLADMPLGPKDMDTLIRRIRRMAMGMAVA